MRRPKISRHEGAHVVGLDLSLTSTGMVAIPLDWDHDMRKVVTGTTGYPLKAGTIEQQLKRALQIAHDVSVFCVNAKASAVFIEDYSFGAGGSMLYERVEMIGRVKTELFDEHSLTYQVVAAARARKILLQHVPRVKGKGMLKKWVVANVKRLSETTSWNEDVCDAFVVANAGLMTVGGTAMTFPGEG